MKHNMSLMKILTLGLDGGDKKIISAMPMPHLHKLLVRTVCLDIEEDLWSRGWAKILSGVPGYESGAFYARPELDGTHSTTQKFSALDYGSNPGIKPSWSTLSDEGYRVGFMNVPSMMPAPQVNGFAISGGGAGASTSGANAILQDACYPPEIKSVLEQSNYILDTRLMSSGFKDVNAFFDQLIKMTKIRTRTFIGLSNKFKIQFGFIAYMAVCRVQYLAMSEIEALINNDCNPSNPFQKKLIHFYARMDEQMGILVNELSPQKIILVSDHGQSPRRYSVNINDWLKQTGLQAPSAQSVSFIKSSAKAIARFFPQGVKHLIGKTAPGLKVKVGGGINADWTKTQAFSVRYVPGIYINDEVRFKGPVANDENKESLIRQIIDKFNRDEGVKSHGFSASEYRQNHSNARHEALLPDIWVDHPDAYFFEHQGQFIQPNKDYGSIHNLEHVDRDMYTGIKGRHPLLCVSPGLAELVRKDDRRDLTLANKLIVRGMGA